MKKNMMNQFKLDMLWLLNKTFVRRGWPLLGIGCMADSEEQTITTRRAVWSRPVGTGIWQEMKPFTGNLPTG